MSWFDRLPSNEKRKLRKRMRSPEEYARLRERVKGPEDLEREMAQNLMLADLKFAIDTEPRVKEELQKEIEQDLKEKGLEQMLESADVSPEAQDALTSGSFKVAIETNGTGNEQMVLQPEGNVAEKIPLKKNVTEQYSSSFAAAGGEGE